MSGSGLYSDELVTSRSCKPNMLSKEVKRSMTRNFVAIYSKLLVEENGEKASMEKPLLA